MKYKKDHTYTTADNKKLHIISVKRDPINAEPLYTVKIDGKFAGINPEPVIDKMLTTKTKNNE